MKQAHKLIDIKEVAKKLEPYSKIQPTLQQYCQISSYALNLQQNQFIDTQKEPQKAKQTTDLVNFLLKPNINFVVLDYYKKLDSKKEDALKDVGKRVVATIAYAWDYYIRLIKGQAEKKEPKSYIFSPETIKQAKKSIMDMLQELKDKNYNWQLFEKDELANQQQLQKEIQQERNFVCLLDNMLKSQTNKVINARNKQPQGQNQQKREIISDKQYNQTPIGPEQTPSKETIDKLINIKGYFQTKKQKLAQKQATKDPIAISEEKRRFNAAVLRFMMNNTQADS